MAHLFCRLPCSWLLFPCLYFDSNCSISLFIAFYYELHFTLQIIISIFWLIKIKTKDFWISDDNHIFFHYYNDWIILSYTFLVILVCWYKRYCICLISFFNLYELFAAFICLELNFLIFFLLLLLCHLLVIAFQINLQIFLCQFFFNL